MCIISSSFLFLTLILPLQIEVVVARQPVQKGDCGASEMSPAEEPQRWEISKQQLPWDSIVPLC